MRVTTFAILAVLVLTAFNAWSISNVKADTSEANILSYSWYIAPSNTQIATSPGDLVVVGEIQNVGSNIIGNASVEGIAYDSNGNVLAIAEAQVFVFHTLPEQKAPFYIDFAQASGLTHNQNWVSSVVTVSVSMSSVTDTFVAQYAGLSIPSGGSVGILINNNTYTVTGYVQNNGNITTGHVWVVTTFYDNTGKVLGLNYTNFLTNSFSPGMQLPFWATPTDNTDQLSSEISNYALLIDSEPLGFSPSPSSTSTASPSSSIVLSLMLPIVVVVVIAAIIVAASMLFRRRQELSLPPPPSPLK